MKKRIRSTFSVLFGNVKRETFAKIHLELLKKIIRKRKQNNIGKHVLYVKTGTVVSSSKFVKVSFTIPSREYSFGIIDSVVRMNSTMMVPVLKANTMSERPWDLVVFGATGDAGMAIATYIANNVDAYKKPGSEKFQWAIAGRSEDKLNKLRSRIIASTSADNEIGVLKSDLQFGRHMSEMANSTRVLVACVGPYTVLGERAYAACVEHGTNYVDVTGEVDWVGSMRGKYQARALETGATLCSFAGYDCVPCDITLYLARKELSKCDGKEAIVTNFETVSYTANGVFPRGTIRTTFLKMKESSSFFGKLVRYADSQDGIHWYTAMALSRWLLPKWSPEYGAFTLPHFMGWCNIPVIHKSHDAFLNCIFHDRFAIANSKGNPSNGYGLLQIIVVYLVMLVVAPPFVCLQIVIFFIPSIADRLLKYFDSLEYRGNSEENQDSINNSTSDIWAYATSSSGAKATVHLHIKGDAGIKATSILASNTAFSMLSLLDKDELPKGLIGSPSVIVGDTLVERLRDEQTIGDVCTVIVTVTEKESSKKKEC